MRLIRDRAALRRATRAALIVPALLAVAHEAVGGVAVATFAVFGAFAMLLLVDFAGPLRARVQAQAALGLAGAALICAGTVVSGTPAAAATATALVGFGILFAGVVSSVLAAASTPLLLAFILASSIPASAAAIPERLAGWGLPAGVSVLAIALLWPAPASDPLRSAAIAACRAVARRVRAAPRERAAAAAEADRAAGALHTAFFGTAYRPTGLTTSARAVVRLVDEVRVLNEMAARVAARPAQAASVSAAAGVLLERGADLLDAPRGDPRPLQTAAAMLRTRLAELEDAAVAAAGERPVVVSALDPGFRAQELGYMALQVAANIGIAAAAERRSWLGKLLGRPPAELGGRFAAAQERAGSHVRGQSVWLRNSVRGGLGLALAVAAASATGVQHGFWVVLGALSVLRSNALSTGQTVLRAVLGTVAGFAAGAALVAALGTDQAVLWGLLPPVVLLAGLAPATVSFAAGQAAFTLTILIVFGIIAPQGLQIGLVRIEDVALGSAVSLVVGLLLWPRGARGALGRALAEAYADSAAYLEAAVRFGVGRSDAAIPDTPVPAAAALRAAAAARRLDDAFRSFLAERGAKFVPLAEITTLVTGVARLRLGGDAVLDLWRRDDGPGGDRAVACGELLADAERVTRWYAALAASLANGTPVPGPLPRDRERAGRLVAAVRRDLRGADGRATATAVRMVWSGDHVDAARRLQAALTGPARAVVRARDRRGMRWPARGRRAAPSAGSRGVRIASGAAGRASAARGRGRGHDAEAAAVSRRGAGRSAPP